MRKYFILALCCVTLTANAVTSTGYRTITKIGCHNVDNTCYVYLDGDAVGPAACQSISIRWNVEQDPNGQATLAMLMSAYYAEKKVLFGVADSCYAYQSGFPAIHHFVIE